MQNGTNETIFHGSAAVVLSCLLVLEVKLNFRRRHDDDEWDICLTKQPISGFPVLTCHLLQSTLSLYIFSFPVVVQLTAVMTNKSAKSPFLKLLSQHYAGRPWRTSTTFHRPPSENKDFFRAWVDRKKNARWPSLLFFWAFVNMKESSAMWRDTSYSKVLH